MSKISVVIPMYNSEKTIEAVVGEVTETLEGMAGYGYEIILVDDCGPDGTLALARSLANRDTRIKLVELAKNSGQPNAMAAGYSFASGDYIVSMDDDLQHDASAIPRFIDALEKNDWDIVFAKYAEHKESGFRRFGSRANQSMAHIMAGKPKDIESNSFFAIRKFVADAIVSYRHTNPYIYGIMFSMTSRIGNVDVIHRERTVGKSNYSFSKLLAFWLNGFLSFSIKPLRVATGVGITISVVSAIVALVMFIERLINPDVGVMGWTSLIIAIIFFSGIQLICVGLLGEYLGRLYITQSGLPSFTVRECRNLNCDTKREMNDGR